jgi:putative membrane-bound dehydrogenase-like protein
MAESRGIGPAGRITGARLQLNARQRLEESSMFDSHAAALAAIIALAMPAVAFAQIGAEDSAKKLKPAPGLKATLWAAEPMVVNPTNMDVDSRGRVWVTEGLNYRLTHGKGFKRVEDADKIKILEDTDGDGKADKVTVFADKIFPIPMGLAVEERYDAKGKYAGCKVYIGNSPDLLVLEDTDGDDKADKRYALLTGFGGVDSDHGVHGMVLGLDGKLYFTHGDGCCSFEQSTGRHDAKNFDVVDKSDRHVSSDQLANTLRVNRDGTHFEVIADRQRNNYETSLNSFGNIFTSDNDDDGNRGCRVIWVMDGGKYGYRTPGSPRHWGEEVPGNVPKLVGTGNGSPCGIMVYEGSLLPSEYLGGLLEADAGTRQINFFPITRKGAAFRTDYKVFLASDDPWFRPVDMTAAPDGAVFVADWYDGGVGGHNFRDQTTGRIYRVVPDTSPHKVAPADFASVKGLIEALRSPVVATQDAARRSLIEKAKTDHQEVETALVHLYSSGMPHECARALWVLHAVAGDRAVLNALSDQNARLREQAVRILGRDDRENGKVEIKDDKAKLPPPALAHLDALIKLTGDFDPGVRRELILALRNVHTDKARAALRSLAASWDGRDRWYLEALGLALENRDSAYLASLFDGTLYGDLDLDRAGKDGNVALPPYFPVDRNEAYLGLDASDLPSSALSKTLGLAWRLHRAEVLPVLSRILPKLEAPELQQAADDVLGQMRDPQTAVVLAELASKAEDPARQRQILNTLARKLDSSWRDAQRRGEIVELVESALKDPELRLEGVAVAAATEDPRYASTLRALVAEKAASEELKAAAVEAFARVKAPQAKEFLNALIDSAKGQKSSNAASVAAVRSLSKVEEPRERLLALLQAPAYPLGLRREALRSFAALNDGGVRVVALAREGKLPDDLKTAAAGILAAHPDGRVRGDAGKVLPQPKGRGGRPLPPFFEMVRKEGHAERGRDVFFRKSAGLDGLPIAGANTCAGCHRAQGRGNWIGPDLSTVGTKYGRDELLRSILNPSAAIGYNFRSAVVALDDGRVITGLPVEDTPDRLVLKTSEGERISVKPAQIEERKSSDISLMPEGLAETMTDQELADLLSFLSSLKAPVSIVGQYHVIGPLTEAKGQTAFDPTARVDIGANLRGPEGQKLSWRRLDANAESLADLSTLLGDDASKSAYVFAPVVSPIAQTARLVVDSKADVRAWFSGKPLALPTASDDGTRSVGIDLPEGRGDLVLRVSGGPNAMIVTTIVADKPVSFGSAR